MYNGVCLQIDRFNRVGSPMPSSIDDCQTQADIAFLLDGSGSINPSDFEKMKTFVSDVVQSFLGRDTKFAIAQFSTGSVIHYYFNTFDMKNWKSQLNGIKRLTGWTYTAAAIRRVVNEVFSPYRGSRSGVTKVLIVITDGESNDNSQLESAADFAEKKKIVRFAIGVGLVHMSVTDCYFAPNILNKLPETCRSQFCQMFAAAFPPVFDTFHIYLYHLL